MVGKLSGHVGFEIRRRRLAQGIKLREVAHLVGISQGMLSKIENNQTNVSLDVLESICKALGMAISEVFGDYDRPRSTAQYVKADQGPEVIGRGTSQGHSYQLLFYEKGYEKVFEPFLITLNDASEVIPAFSHPGIEFLYIIQGKLTYRVGEDTYDLEPFDSLTFDSLVPHGPIHLEEVPVKLLSIFCTSSQN
ncbi:helix-turn-helix domain-containing protein [Kordiimonas lipolytica]|uniref:Helix-turn-helix domain-containing protein n=1 Tax=Kordiimonas lipolytica TaxID=1662421 RepID=A0ABV8UD57_9PROT|nr:XRE family transcriptional regulator [Kordiimonas lipolytica]